MIGSMYSEFFENITYVRDLIASDRTLGSKCDTASITGAVSAYGELEILGESVPYEDVCLNCKLDDCDDTNPMCRLRNEHGIKADGTSAVHWISTKAEDNRRKIYQMNKDKVVIPAQQTRLF